MNFHDLAGRTSKLLIDNSPHILTAIGVVGTVTTAYLAGKASFQAADMIRLKEGLDDQAGRVIPEPREVIKERVELVWKLYIPPAVMLTATIAAIVTANQVSAGRAAGIATAYTLLERNYSEHKEKLIEKLGERKAEAFEDEIAQDRVNQTWVDDVTLMGIDKGEVCLDLYGNQYFTSTRERIGTAVNDFNALLLSYDQACLADFYRLLDIEAAPYSESVGWTSNRLMELDYSSTLINETKPCLTISFKKDPLPDYGRFH